MLKVRNQLFEAFSLDICLLKLMSWVPVEKSLLTIFHILTILIADTFVHNLRQYAIGHLIILCLFLDQLRFQFLHVIE